MDMAGVVMGKKRVRKYDPVKNREYQQRYRSKLPPERVEKIKDQVRQALRVRRSKANPLFSVHQRQQAEHMERHEARVRMGLVMWTERYISDRLDLMPLDEQLIAMGY